MRVDDSPDPILTEDAGAAPDVALDSLVRFENRAALFTSIAPVEPSLPSVVLGSAETSADLQVDEAVVGLDVGSEVGSDLGGEVRPDVFLDGLVIFERTPLGPRDRSEIEEFAEARGAHLSASRTAFRKAIILEWTESLAMVLAFILVFTGYVAQATQVPTESMKPTILVGDHFFIEKLAFPGNYPAAVRPFLPERSIRRGDIVVFRSPVDGKIPFVKRVIGTPGDRVEIREKAVFVNGVELDEPYKIHVDKTVHRADGFTPEDLKKRDNYGPTVVPPDSFFVMGDNRDNSNDSRYWGYVGRDAIMGMPLFVYWSYRQEPYGGSPPTIAERLNDYVSTATHFFSRTRWFRFGTLVQ